MQATYDLQPISERERLLNVDVLRGFALLGILLMNIPGFAMPQYFSETWRADPSNVNFWYRAVITVLFEGKMRALFSMIFGVGILLFVLHKTSGWKTTELYYKRMGWLILFGLVDAHILLWSGDILYIYGVCGLIAFLFRKVNPAILIIGVPIVAAINFVSLNQFNQGIRTEMLAYREATAAVENKQKLTDAQQKAIVGWRETEKFFFPNKKDVAENTTKMKSSYPVVADYQRPIAWDFQTKYLLLTIWDPIVLMLLGMALYKWGFLSGAWSRRQYMITALIGYGLGLPLVIYAYWYGVVHFPNVEARLQHLVEHPINWVDLIYDFQRIFLVMAHASVILLILKSEKLKALMSRFAAVGRMAFTNYVMHTLICTFIFFGYGLNYFAELQYYQLYFIVLGIWMLQLWLSPLWLKNFQFGPLEWAWRSLTYWKRQPMKNLKASKNR